MDDRRGFPLLEVLVSLAILSATLLLAYQVISGAIAAEDRSERWTSATCLAEALGRCAPPMAASSWRRSVRPAAHADAREVHVAVTWSVEERAERVTLSGVAVK